jgi:NAD(P)H-nitrite reductase large subunit
LGKKFDNSFVVCSCRYVTLGEIIYAIKEKGAKTIEDVGILTDAGVACKCCQSASKDVGEEKLELYIDDILKKFVG